METSSQSLHLLPPPSPPSLHSIPPPSPLLSTPSQPNLGQASGIKTLISLGATQQQNQRLNILILHIMKFSGHGDETDLGKYN